MNTLTSSRSSNASVAIFTKMVDIALLYNLRIRGSTESEKQNSYRSIESELNKVGKQTEIRGRNNVSNDSTRSI